MEPRRRIDTQWSADLAYAIGLITTDGNLSSDGRHISLTSKDLQQLYNLQACLGITVKIGYKTSGYTGEKISHVQFGDTLFYKFLESIGLSRAKTKTIGELKVPDSYFFDFLRGHYDGDGTFYSYFDRRWRSSYMFYTVFISASERHIIWIRDNLCRLLGVKGHLVKTKNRSKSVIYQARYAKHDSLQILPRMYYSDKIVCLERKYLKIKQALKLESNHARVL